MKHSGTKKIALRYVKALFDVSRSAPQQVEKDLLTLAPLLAESAALCTLLASPIITRREQAKAMELVLEKIKAHEITRQFIALLTQKKRLALLPQIITLYCEWSAAARGEMKAQAVSAMPLSASDIAAISAKLGETYGKKILLETREDPELLGGVIVKIGGMQLDSSIAGKLDRLKHRLKAA